jgi:PAS domain S-box-containing protein
MLPTIGVIAAIVLLLAGGLVAFYSQYAYRTQKLSEVRVQAQVVAESVAGALAFEDQAAAKGYLGALRANPELAAAAAYDDKGRLSASYSRSAKDAPPRAAPAAGSRIEGRYFIVVTPVIQGSTRLGSVYLRTDAESFVKRVRRYTGVALLALMASLVVGVFAAAHAAVRRANATLSDKADALHSVATRQQAIFDAAFDAIVTLNPSGGIETINRAGERMFGRPAEELARRDIGMLIDLGQDGDGNFLQRVEGSAGSLAGGLLRELTARRADGTAFPVDLALSSMELPDGLHVVAVIRDITDRRKTEQLKEEFVSTVSHELRTPLTSIAGSLGLLAGGAAGELPEKAGRLLSIAHSNCQRLVRLINDILDIEKLESGALRFDFGPVRLDDLIARSVEGVRGYAAGLRIRADITPDAAGLLVRGDADRLIQVLTNLLSNALKFSPIGGEVEVSLARQGHVARLTVRDHGAGIPDEFRSRVFSKFAQADSTDSRQRGGTGLGLAISKEIVDRHGGRLSFDSVVGEGSSFHVDLPLIEAARPAPQPVSSERLLICEDDADTATILRETLERDGFAVDVVGTLEAAAAATASGDTYAAVLLDLQLPDGDGINLIRDLRDRDATRDLPIIVVSAYVDAGRDAARSHCLNVVDWMEKPVDVSRLQRAVKAALDRPRPAGRQATILHVDDDHDILQVTATALADLGRIVSVDSLAAARTVLDELEPDLVILDIGLADGSGLELLPDLDRFGGEIPVVVFSAQEANARILHRVDEVLVKSRSSMASLTQTVRRLVRSSELQDP